MVEHSPQILVREDNAAPTTATATAAGKEASLELGGCGTLRTARYTCERVHGPIIYFQLTDTALTPQPLNRHALSAVGFQIWTRFLRVKGTEEK